MINPQANPYPDGPVPYVVVKLKFSSPEELRRFLASPWSTSILSPEEIEKLYQELHQQEGSLQDGIEMDFIEMGRD